MKELTLPLLLLAAAAAATEQPTGGRWLPDFKQFVVEFGKHYAGPSELLRRQTIYAASSARVFLSGLKFHLRRLDFYLAINQMSDRTRAEVSRTHLQRPQSAHAGRLEAEEPELAVGARDDALNALLAATRVARAPQPSSAAPGRNQDVREKSGRSQKEPGCDQTASGCNRSDQGAQTSNLFGWIFNRRPPDQVYVDHRRSGCLLAARRQGTCGSCYLFAAVALYEWLYCNQTGARVAFSEQYGLDCGASSGLGGCEGAEPHRVVEFTRKHGLELRSHYPYLARPSTCPYPDDEQPHRMGYLRADQVDFQLVRLADFERALRHSPLVVTVAPAAHFHEYGGGVDAGRGCNQAEGHAMLLVGHGREGGAAYWLLRNSYGVKFGQAGHYKLSRAAAHCILDATGWRLVGAFKPDGAHNDAYAHRHLRRQYAARLALLE